MIDRIVVPSGYWGSEMTAVMWSPDGRSLAAAFGSGTIAILDAEALTPRRWVLDVPSTGICFSPDGSYLAAVGKGGVALIEPESGVLCSALGTLYRAQAVTVSPDGKNVAACSRWGQVRTWVVANSSLRDYRHDRGE